MMKRISKTQSSQSTRKGAFIPLLAVLLPVILVFVAFSVDIAYIQLTRTELRTATDAAARAASRTLSVSQSMQQAEQAAISAAALNSVGGKELTLESTDIETGYSERSGANKRYGFTKSTDPEKVNAIRILASKTEGSASGPVELFFGNIGGGGPFEPVQSATATHLDRDIVLVLDRSGSMSWDTDGASLGWTDGAAIPDGARWQSLAMAVDTFLLALADTPQREQVALATFAHTASFDVGLTEDYSLIRDRVQDLSELFNGGGTAIGLGMQEGKKAFDDPAKSRPAAIKTMIVMTDGVDYGSEAPESVATTLSSSHDIVIHTVTFSNGADQERMKLCAKNGEGTHNHATSQMELKKKFEKIARNVPTLLTD